MPATELILSPATLPDDAIEVARIADAWGVKGWFKVIAMSSDPQALLKAKVWFIQPPEKGARHFQGAVRGPRGPAQARGGGLQELRGCGIKRNLRVDFLPLQRLVGAALAHQRTFAGPHHTLAGAVFQADIIHRQ